MSLIEFTRPELSNIDPDTMGHVPFDFATGPQRQGDLLLLPQGTFVLGERAFPDLTAVSLRSPSMTLSRLAGYGRVLTLTVLEETLRLRYINRTWYRLAEDGPPLGHSIYYRAQTSFPEWRSIPTEAIRLSLSGERVGVGPVSLYGDGIVTVFDLCFPDPESEIDVSSPVVQLCRKGGTNYLAVELPAEGYLIPTCPGPSAPNTLWYQYEDGAWQVIVPCYGRQPARARVRKPKLRLPGSR